MMIRIVSLTHGGDSSCPATVVAERCEVAKTFFSRFKGLMGKKNLNSGEGLLLSPCHEIHMWWMRIPIDVVFLQKEPFSNQAVSGDTEFYQVTSVVEFLKPWRLLPVRDGNARDTLELPIGTIQRCELKAGTRLEVSKIWEGSSQ